ncbi:RraA family protein [Brucellaceae bacterium D45D]
MKYHIVDMPESIAPDLADRLSKVDTATLGHMLQYGFMHRQIQTVSAGSPKIVGCAVTLALPGMDSALLHYATGLLRHGDILVIDRLNDDKFACLGGGVANAAKQSGAIGAIIDGPCTDVDELEDMDFPVWSRGISAITTGRYNIGGRMNFTVSCGGVPVFPGDVIVADRSGVVVLPRSNADRLADEALARQQAGDAKGIRVRAGEKLADLSGATEMVQASLIEHKKAPR